MKTPVLVWAMALYVVTGCGARTGLRLDRYSTTDGGTLDVPEVMDIVAPMDVTDVPDVTDVTDVRDVRDVPDSPDACVPVSDGCGPAEICGDGLDNDCNGQVDDGCGCQPGAVQPCFAGPPGRRGIGACHDGAQVCTMAARWGACVGGIIPRPDVCNGEDNLCNGCSQQNDCPIACPEPGDSRVPDGAPFQNYTLHGRSFYPGEAVAWHWTVSGGPCDVHSRRASFALAGADMETATFQPTLSGDYQVTLSVVTVMGHTLTCSWIVHVAGPGLRVEMCYPENTSVDLDLYLSRPGYTGPWYPQGVNVFEPATQVCGWHDCEAIIRGATDAGVPVGRADWGYANGPLAECGSGPHGPEWSMLGFCANPRLDIDNNLSKATGVPENINLDAPREGETFRVMVQDFSGTLAHPLVNIYCSGRRVATYGQAPDTVNNFRGDTNPAVGAMWRVVDVTTHRDAMGRTTCDLAPLHPPGTATGYDVTYNNPRF